MQHELLWGVAEIHAVEDDLALERYVRDGTRALVRMLPCPDAAVGVAVALLIIMRALHAPCTHERDVAVVLFGELVEQLEDAFGASEAHDHEVDLVGDLADGAGEAFGEIQEGNHDVDGEDHAGDGGVGDGKAEEEPSRKGDYHVGEVAEVHEDGAEDVRVDVCLLCGLEELVIYLVELLLHLLLMREDLDDLLTVHGLFGKALRSADGVLLGEEEASGLAAHEAGEPSHEGHHHKHDKRERYGVPQHDEGERDHGDRHGEQVWQGDADELAQGVHVVRIVAHDVAALIAVKEAYGQIFHVVKHLVSDLHEGALRHEGAKLSLGDLAGERDGVGADEHDGDLGDLRTSRRPVAGLPVAADDIDGALQVDAREGREHRRDYHADEHERELQGIEGKHELDGAAKHRHGIGCVPAAAAFAGHALVELVFIFPAGPWGVLQSCAVVEDGLLG